MCVVNNSINIQVKKIDGHWYNKRITNHVVYVEHLFYYYFVFVTTLQSIF